MRPKLIRNISPEVIRREVKIAEYIMITSILVAFIFLILSIFIIDARMFALVGVVCIICFLPAYFIDGRNNIYHVHLFDNHLEVVNWLNRVVKRINYTDIDIIEIKIIKDIRIGHHIDTGWYIVNSLCLGITVSKEELDALTERNTFMNLLRYSKKCVPMAYDEDLYQFLKEKCMKS